MKVRKAVIPAAGLGTRFLPATKAMPKEMLPLVDTPTIQYIVQEAIDSGIEEILIITGKSKRAIEDHFDKNVELELELEKKANEELLKVVRDITDLVDIHYIRQKEAKGLGHAIYCAKTFVGNEPFAVMLGDDVVYTEGTPCLKQMIDVYDQYQTSVVGVQTVKDEDVCKYGIVDGERVSDRVYTVKDLVEKPAVGEAPSNVAILGRYIINPGIFDILAETKPGKGGEIQLTDALKELALQEDMYAYDFIGKRYDVGNKQSRICGKDKQPLMEKFIMTRIRVRTIQMVPSFSGTTDPAIISLFLAFLSKLSNAEIPIINLFCQKRKSRKRRGTFQTTLQIAPRFVA